MSANPNTPVNEFFSVFCRNPAYRKALNTVGNELYRDHTIQIQSCSSGPMPGREVEFIFTSMPGNTKVALKVLYSNVHYPSMPTSVEIIESDLEDPFSYQLLLEALSKSATGQPPFDIGQLDVKIVKGKWESQGEETKVDKTMARAGDRPIPGSNIDTVLDALSKFLLELPPTYHDEILKTARHQFKDLIDEIRWHTNRWSAFERGLCYIAVGQSTAELQEFLKKRRDVLLHLFQSEEATNEEIKEAIRTSNRPRLTDQITFNVPRDYKPGDSLKIMGNAIRAIEDYERKFKPVLPEPMAVIEEPIEGTLNRKRRWINPEWYEWQRDRDVNEPQAEHILHERIMKDYQGPEFMEGDQKPRIEFRWDREKEMKEIIISYRAFL